MIRETKEAFYKVAFLPWLVPTYLPSKLQALPHVTKGSHKNEGMKVVLLAGGLVVKGGDSKSEGRHFKSWRRILEEHFSY